MIYTTDSANVAARRFDFIMSVVIASIVGLFLAGTVALGAFALYSGMPIILAGILTVPFAIYMTVKLADAITDCKYDHNLWVRVR